MQYRRSDVKGGSYFLTINLAQRNQDLLLKEIDLLRSSLVKAKNNHPFIIEAMVVLPDHLHLIITLPPNDNDYAKRIMLFKSGFSRQIPKLERINKSRKIKRERGIWQRRYWEHLIKDENDFNRHVDYIHYNPVKHGYVNKPSDWQYSTIHRFIKNGTISPNWGNNIPEFNPTHFGE